MKTPLLLIPLAICCLTAPAAAQDASAPVSDALRSTAKRAGTNLVAAAEEMPAGKYGYKPTPAQMSFGDVIAHLSGGNYFLCSSVAGVDAPKRAEITGKAPRAQLVSALRESFQFCESALVKVNDSGLSQKVPFFGNREVSRAEMMFAAAEDWADHYSQLANYLRLNKLLPPTAKQKQE
jgi:DinB family protein